MVIERCDEGSIMRDTIAMSEIELSLLILRPICCSSLFVSSPQRRHDDNSSECLNVNKVTLDIKLS